MKRKERLAIGTVAIAAIALIIALATGGGPRKNTHVQKSTGPPTTRAFLGHPCSPQHYFMQCALTTPSRTLAPPARTPLAHGIDFAWSCPSPGGWDFAASYLSPDPTKNFTLACINKWHAAGRKTVAVWESSAARATQGFNAGFQDAFNARIQYRRLGAPDNRPIDYAVDCDCAPGQIFYYFGGVVAGTASILHIPRPAAIQLVGEYGGYSQVLAMYNAHLLGHTSWMTYAWQNGHPWLPASIAPLEQFQNDNSVDYDRAIASDYGQWPYNVRVHCFGPGARLKDPHCKIVRPQVSARTHEIQHIRQVSYFHFKCWQRRTPHGPAVSGINGRRAFCQRLGRIEQADHAYIKANLY